MCPPLITKIGGIAQALTRGKVSRRITGVTRREAFLRDEAKRLFSQPPDGFCRDAPLLTQRGARELRLVAAFEPSVAFAQMGSTPTVMLIAMSYRGLRCAEEFFKGCQGIKAFSVILFVPAGDVNLSQREDELLKLLKCTKNDIARMKNGVRLEGLLGQTLDILILQGAADRYALANNFLASAKKLNNSRPGLFRDSISRSYYAMYHAARAAAYLNVGGDDHEHHNKVASFLPNTPTNLAVWQNKLNTARLLRNEADYDPYPPLQRQFARLSKTQYTTATDFLREVGNYRF